MTGTKISLLVASLIAVLFSAIPSRATAASVADVEIGQLLGYIEHSGCAVYRNGTWYSASSARALGDW
jgi:hypothetical protein